MIKSVARVYGWGSPEVIENFYFDETDMHGLIFWYNDAREQDEELKKSTKDGKLSNS